MDPTHTPTADDVSGMLGGSYLGTMLFSLLTTATLMALVAAFVRQFREGVAPEEMTVGGLWDDARSLILPSLGLMLAYGLVVMLSVLIIVVPCLGILAWLVGVVWALPYVSVTYAVRMLEGGTLGAAFTRARDLVKGRWGVAGGGMLLTGLVMFLIASALAIPFYIAAFAFGANALTDPAAMVEMMGWMMGPLQVLNTVAYLVPLVAAFVVHGALVGQRDGGGLWAEVDRLAGDAAVPAPGDLVSELDRLTGRPATDAPAGDTDGDGPAGDAPPGGFRGGGYAP